MINTFSLIKSGHSLSCAANSEADFPFPVHLLFSISSSRGGAYIWPPAGCKSPLPSLQPLPPSSKKGLFPPPPTQPPPPPTRQSRRIPWRRSAGRSAGLRFSAESTTEATTTTTCCEGTQLSPLPSGRAGDRAVWLSGWPASATDGTSAAAAAAKGLSPSASAFLHSVHASPLLRQVGSVRFDY